jgi:hypothetical protein
MPSRAPTTVLSRPLKHYLQIRGSGSLRATAHPAWGLASQFGEVRNSSMEPGQVVTL